MSIKWCRNCKSIGLRCANRLVPLGANLLAYVVQIAGAISVQIDKNSPLDIFLPNGIRMTFHQASLDTSIALIKSLV